jgi:hypothetical protein
MATEARHRAALAPADRRPSSVPVALKIATVLACAALFLLPGVVLADSMRCGNRIIKEEDTMEKVLEVCGEPATKKRTWIERAPQYELGGLHHSFPGTEEVPVDLWTYDLGSNKFLQQVRFIDGIVDSIVTLPEKGTK